MCSGERKKERNDIIKAFDEGCHLFALIRVSRIKPASTLLASITMAANGN